MRISSLILPAVALGAMVYAQQAVEVQTNVRTNVRTDVRTKVQANVRHFASADAAGATSAMVMQISLKSIKGAPYSAELTDESVQTLADGNRIVNKSTTKMFRDSEGRTRMEIAPAQAGAWVPGDKGFSMTMIDDPATGEHISLKNMDKTATKFTAVQLSTKHTEGDMAPGKKHVVISEVRTAGPGGAGGELMTQDVHGVLAGGVHAPGRPGDVMMFRQFEPGDPVIAGADLKMPAGMNVKTESLGKRVIEGVEATGTRETMTLAAGAVGNERAIDVVTETWTSEALGFDLLRTTTDPRFGQTTQRIANLVRAEQPKSLFEIPSDYKLEEASGNVQIMRVEKKIK